MSSFKALLIEKTDAGQTVQVVDFPESDLMEGDVTLKVLFSTVNYKDGLAITGKLPVVRRWPMIPGVDLVGEVESSQNPAFKPGDKVLMGGYGMGETHLGAYAKKARVKSEWLVPLPAGLSPEDAMSLGTAGLTSMLSLMALERHGVKPADGPVVVTGASGGVGSVAVALLARHGFHVAAVTGKAEEAAFLKELGASEIIDRGELSGPAKLLGKERWAAAIDAVGSHILANVLSQTKYGGVVAACGNAMGMDLPTSVAPFILRGVTLVGIESVFASTKLRQEAWTRLAAELDHAKITRLATRIGFDGIVEAATKIAQGKIKGRILVDING